MWPFVSKRKRVKDEIARSFSRYLSPTLVEEAVRAGTSSSGELTPARIHFLLLQVPDNDLGKARADISKAIDIVIQSTGLIDHIGCSVVSTTFGLVPPDDDARAVENRCTAVARLLAELGPNVKVLTGDADGVHGNLGSSQRMRYGFAVPGFAAYISKLLQLEFGQAVQVGHGPSGS